MSSIRRTPPTRQLTWWLLAPAIAGLVAAGCSSDLADASPTTVVATVATEPAPTTTVAATPVTVAPADIVGTALINHVFTQLAGMVVDAGLVETLRGGPFTVFAPTDDAFAKLPLDVLHSVQDDPDTLATVLTYHVVAGELKAADLEDGPLETVSGLPLTISHDDDGNVLVDGHPIAAADIQASNGIVHVMGDVLVPES